jgi:hypothetical protein
MQFGHLKRRIFVLLVLMGAGAGGAWWWITGSPADGPLELQETSRSSG